MNRENGGNSGHSGLKEESILEISGQFADESRLYCVMAENHRRFAEHSEQPRLTKDVRLLTPDSKSRVSDRTGEPVHHDRVAIAVNDVFNLTDHARQPLRRKTALEYRKLYALTVTFANLCDFAQPNRSNAVRIRDVVGDQNVHGYGITNGGYAGRSPRRWRASRVACTDGRAQRPTCRPTI